MARLRTLLPRYYTNLDTLLKNEGYTDAEVVQDIGISRRTLTKYRHGHCPIPFKKKLQFAQFLRIPVSNIVCIPLEPFRHVQPNEAKQDIPAFTLDYIEALEACVSTAWKVWRDLSYYLHEHHDNHDMSKVRAIAKQQMDLLSKNFQNIGFLDTKEERHDPSPTDF